MLLRPAGIHLPGGLSDSPEKDGQRTPEGFEVRLPCMRLLMSALAAHLCALTVSPVLSGVSYLVAMHQSHYHRCLSALLAVQYAEH